MHWILSVKRSCLTGKQTVPSLVIMALMLFLLPLRWLGAACLAALIHELGHYCAVYLCGGRVQRFVMVTSGAKMQAIGLTTTAEIICLLAGPLTGLIPLLFFRWFPIVAVCGLFQSAYNLLPIFPLDGGKILKLILQRYGGTERYYQVIERVILCILVVVYIHIRLQFGISLLFLVVHVFSEKFLAKNS